MKRQYEKPSVELLYVDSADILTMSKEDDYADEEDLNNG